MDIFFSVLAKKYRATDGDLAACRIAKRYCNKKHGGILLLLANNYKATDGDLATCRIAKRFCNPQKIYGGIFWGAILAGIGGGTECVPEGYRPGGQAPESP